MKSTTLYRPHTYDETMGLIAETLDALLDGRTDGVVYDALREWDSELPEHQFDAGTLRTALRYLLPSKGVADSRLRVEHGWTTDEITQIIALLRITAKALRGAAPHALNPGTTLTLVRDADKINRLIERWSMNGGE